MSNARFHNTTELEAYIAGVNDPFSLREDMERLVQKELMEEFMFLGLRMTAGVSGADFASRFHKTLDEAYGPVIRRHVAQGLLQPTADGFCLTERGTDVSNYVMADYLM